MPARVTASITHIEPMPRNDYTTRDFVLIVVLGLLFFGLNVDFVLYGDAAMYADYVTLRKFDELTLHIGYYGVVYVADLLARNLLNMPIQETMVYVNAIAGSLTLGVSYLLARELMGGRREALLCTVIMAVSGRVFTNSTTSEIYMLQTLLILTSFFAFVRGRSMISGALAACALLVSPLSAFTYAFFFAYEHHRSRRLWSTSLLVAIAAGAAIYVPYLIAFGRELLLGVRGLLVIRDITPISPSSAFVNFCKYQFEAYTVMLVLLLPFAASWRRYRPLMVLFASTFVPHLYIILKLTGEDNVFMLPIDFFFACLLAAGAVVAWERWKGAWVPSLVITGHVVLYLVAGGYFSRQWHESYQAEVRAIADRYVKGRDALFVTDWGTAQAFVFFGRDSATSVLRMDPLYGQVVDIENLPSEPYDLPPAGSIVLFDTWQASPMSRLLRGKDDLQRLENDWSTLGRARRLLNIECTLLQKQFGRLYQCTRFSRAPS